jgi:hypothetical protein
MKSNLPGSLEIVGKHAEHDHLGLVTANAFEEVANDAHLPVFLA